MGLGRMGPEQVHKEIDTIRASGDVDNGGLFYGQDAGSINDITSAVIVVERRAQQAEEILQSRFRQFQH